jgi:hypothetical protein
LPPRSQTYSLSSLRCSAVTRRTDVDVGMPQHCPVLPVQTQDQPPISACTMESPLSLGPRRLEDAEAAMQAQRLQHEKANPRLAKAVARDEGAEAS